MQSPASTPAAPPTPKAMFDKLASARSTLDKARVELTQLAKLGDLVTPEDVIKSAGKLIGAGLSPMALAKLLSDMPEQGPALSSWVSGHAQQLTQREAQLDPILASARHQLGVEGMRQLIGHTIAPAQAPVSTIPPNPLTPSSSSSSPGALDAS